MPKDGRLLVIPGGFPAELADLFADDDRDDELRWRLCLKYGHIRHTCPACGDVSCLRCKVGLDG